MARDPMNPGESPARRARVVRKSIASAALEGRAPTPAVRKDLSLFVTGKINERDLIKNFHQRIDRQS
jgi:hypothetical protein